MFYGLPPLEPPLDPPPLEPPPADPPDEPPLRDGELDGELDCRGLGLDDGEELLGLGELGLELGAGLLGLELGAGLLGLELGAGLLGLELAGVLLGLELGVVPEGRLDGVEVLDGLAVPLGLVLLLTFGVLPLPTVTVLGLLLTGRLEALVLRSLRSATRGFQGEELFDSV